MRTGLTITLKSLRQLGVGPLYHFALYKLGLKTGHFKRMEKGGLAKSQPLSELASLFSLPAREQILQALNPDSKASLIREAAEIMDGYVRLFGGQLAPLQLTFDQQLRHWTDYEKDHRLLDSFYSLVPDIKFLWEPARFGFAFTLGRAYCVTQDNKYADAFWKYFEQFSEGNPPYIGPHWMNGQEIAIRLLSFIWTDQIFVKSAASTTERRSRLARSTAVHAFRIAQTLIYARAQNNNHLVTEAAALFSAGIVLGNTHWRALGWRWLNWAFQHQIGEYGEYIQHSTNYQRLMLQTALWATSILKHEEKSWPAQTAQALARASHWLFSLLDSTSGQVPNLGSNDGSIIFPLTSCSFSDHRPVVQAAARAFLRTGLPSGTWDELSVWFGFPASSKTYQPHDYLSDNLRAKESWAYLRASRFKSRLSHMDQLHLDLWWRGINVAQDAGTYLYNAEAPWENALVSTRVHNTVIVDGQDQMTRGGRFLTLDWFPAYSKTMIHPQEAVLQQVMAYHNGYRGVRHERTVTAFADEHWKVDDQLTAVRPSPVSYRLHWLLPDWEWKMENSERREEKINQAVEIKLKSPYGWMALILFAELPAPNLSSLVTIARAGELIHGSGRVLPIDGWASSTYGQKSPALSVAVEVKSSQSVRFTSEFIFPK